VGVATHRPVVRGDRRGAAHRGAPADATARRGRSRLKRPHAGGSAPKTPV